MRATRANVQSKKKSGTEETEHHNNRPQEQKVFFKIVDVPQKVTSDQTGQFHTSYRKGNKYILVIHDVDSNAILAEPIRKKIRRGTY